MYAVVLLPNFSLQCALRQIPEIHSESVALIAEAARAGGPMVSEITDAAASCGVASGMSVPQAQARCLELVLLRASPAQEAIATTALLQAAERASPYLENTQPGPTWTPCRPSRA